MAKIRHIAFLTDNPQELADFYVETFGMKVTQPLMSTPESGSWIFLTDGYIDMALISPNKRDRVNGINHFGFTLEDKTEYNGVIEKLKKHGITPRPVPPERPYAEEHVFDPHGNRIDITAPGLRVLAKA
jgi:catechol 2,3-dioxygenase-like lactoylglutathione lyase family enzyme